MQRLFLALTVMLLASAGRADERLFGIACRSVHLQMPGPAAVAFYNRVTVDRSADGTYFCVCGFGHGYYGIQELGDGKKVLLFSVWDPGNQNDPKAVATEQRVKLLHRDPQVRVGRFGNEGTGGQSFLDLDWKAGETYEFLVTAKPEGQRTAFAAYLRVPDAKEWRHLVTFSTITGGKLLGGYYAFVEDFRRNRISTTKPRVARYGPAWVKPVDADWKPLTEVRFTGDRNPATNIDARVKDGWFLLATGGDTKNTGTPLNQRMQLEAPSRPAALADAPLPGK